MTERAFAELDLESAIRVLNEAKRIAVKFDQTEIEIDPPFKGGRSNNADKARITRDLLRAAELCRLAAAEFMVVYFTFKDYDDPRYEEE